MTTVSGVRVMMAAGLILAAGASWGTSALAQTQPDNRPPDAQAPLGGPEVRDRRAPCGRGPEVRDRKVPGVAGSFGDNADGQKRRMADRIPPRVMREAMRVVMDDQAPDDLRATPEQRERIQGYVREYETQSRDYLEQHRKELEELRSKLPEGAMNGPAGEIFRRLDGDKRGGPGGPEGRGGGDGPKRRPPGEQGAGKARKAAEDIPVEVREQLRDIAAGMPPFEQVYTKVWAELRPEQQKAVDARLAEFRDRQSQMRQDMYVEKRMRKDGDGKQPPPGRRRPADGARIGPGPEGGPPDGAPRAGARRPGPMDGDRRERLLRAFERMSPEQQEQVLSRLESRGGDQPPARPQGKRPPAPKRGERKPPPDADRMPVPPPPPPPPADGDEMNPDRP